MRSCSCRHSARSVGDPITLVMATLTRGVIFFTFFSAMRSKLRASSSASCDKISLCERAKPRSSASGRSSCPGIRRADHQTYRSMSRLVIEALDADIPAAGVILRIENLVPCEAPGPRYRLSDCVGRDESDVT